MCRGEICLNSYFKHDLIMTQSGEWKTESGKRKVENGKWKVESGKLYEWKVENGEWKVKRCGAHCEKIIVKLKLFHFTQCESCGMIAI